MTTDPITAILTAEADARTAHDEGTCHLSEWSCSWCESEATA